MNKNKILKDYKIFKKYKKRIKILFEKVYILAIYFYAFVFQLYTLKGVLGTLPEPYYTLIPFLKEILENRYLQVLGSPEKCYVVFLLITQVTVFQPSAHFSALSRFTTLYIFILELVQTLLYYCVDFFCTNDFQTVIISKNMSTKLVQNIYILFLLIYLYSFGRAITGRFPKFPGVFQTFVDSIAFWLRIKRVKQPKENNLEN